MIVESHTQEFDLPPIFLPLLRQKAEDVMVERPADYVIGGEDEPYVLRWYLRREPEACCYIHRFLRDDDDRALHDHPWPSFSILLEGSLTEIYAPPMTDPKDPSTYKSRDLEPGSIVLRSETFSHRIELRSREAVTLFTTGRRLRRWGFWCPQGWRDYQDFLSPSDSGQVGRGCD